MVICIDVVSAHCALSGVNIYLLVIVLLTNAGLQVPVMPLVEIAGSSGAADPIQIGAMAVNTGMVSALTFVVSE